MKAEWMARTEGGFCRSLRSEHGGWLGYVIKDFGKRWRVMRDLGPFSSRLIGFRPTAREAAQLLEDYVGCRMGQAQGPQL